IDDVRLYNYPLNAAQIAALASNTAPILAAISNRVIFAGTTLTITNSAIDAESPPQSLTYSLVGPPPPASGASVNPVSGVFVWRPAISQSGTNPFNIQVSDDGVPSLSATQSFSVIVNRPIQPGLSGATISNGQFKMLISGDAGPDYTVQSS